jgi:hypothetical protein
MANTDFSNLTVVGIDIGKYVFILLNEGLDF